MTQIKNTALEKTSLLMLIVCPYISFLLHVGFYIITKGRAERSIPYTIIWIIQVATFILAVISAVQGTKLKKVAIVKLSYIPLYLAYFALDRYFSTFEQFNRWGGPNYWNLQYESDASSLLYGSIANTSFCIFLVGQMVVWSGIYMLGLEMPKSWKKILCKICGFILGLDIIAIVYLLVANRNSDKKTGTGKEGSNAITVDLHAIQSEKSSQNTNQDTRKTVGQILLFACLIASYVIVKCNIAVVIHSETITYYATEIISASDAWLATLLWGLTGWIPNIASTILLHKYGREYRILSIISWVIYLFVLPTGIFNPIPMGV